MVATLVLVATVDDGDALWLYEVALDPEQIYEITSKVFHTFTPFPP
jgi:hypothetical protein